MPVKSKIDPIIVEYAKTKNKALIEPIIEKYGYLTSYIARKLAFNRDDVEELIQIGNIAILKALDRFDVNRNINFSTFATPTIIGEIKHYFRDNSRLVKMPRRLQELNTKINAEIKIIENTNTRITVAELSKRLNESEELIIEAMEAGVNMRVLSLDNPNYSGFTQTSSRSQPAIVDQIQYQNSEDSYLIKETLKQALRNLPPRDRRVCYLRFYGGLSQVDIATLLDLSQMHISRILSKSIRSLRKKIKLYD
jgi:RNA polymerase sigma-B factor